MNDVLYTKSNWENSPSTNTPFYADRLNNMDNGIENCTNRVNGSIPTDNILDTNDASAVTRRETYIHDAIDMKEVSNRIGMNNIASIGNYYSIKNDLTDTAAPLGIYNLVKIADINPQRNYDKVVESSITFTATSIQNYDKLTIDDFFVCIRNIFFSSSYYIAESLISQNITVCYDKDTGIGKVDGLFFMYRPSVYALANVSVYAKSL